MYTDLKDVKLDYFFTPKKLAAMKSPRAIKSHLPFFLLPPKLIDTCKVNYFLNGRFNPKNGPNKKLVFIRSYMLHEIQKMLSFHFTTITDFFKNSMASTGIWKNSSNSLSTMKVKNNFIYNMFTLLII